MRRWPVAAGVAAALLLGLPWVLGSRVGQAYQDVLSSLQDQGLQVVESGYERGWLRSVASTDFLPVRASPGASGFGLRIRSNIDHGPWWLDQFRLRPAAARIRSRLELVVPGAATSDLLIDSLIGLEGSVRMRLVLPATRAATADKLGVEIAEGGGELYLSPGAESLSGWFELPAVTLAAHGGEGAQLRGLRLEVSGARDGERMFEGTLRLTAAEFRSALPNGGLEVGDVSVVIENRPEMGLLNARAAWRAERLQVGGRAYGPSEVVLSLERVPGAELAALRQSLREISAQPVAGSVTGIAVGAVLAELLPRLLAADPAIALEHLELSTAEGPVGGHASLSVQGLTRTVMAQPGAWISHLVGEGELLMPKALLLELFQEWRQRQALADLRKTRGDTAEPPPDLAAETADAARVELDRWLRDGWLVERNGRVSATLRLGDALLTINGKTLPISDSGSPVGMEE